MSGMWWELAELRTGLVALSVFLLMVMWLRRQHKPTYSRLPVMPLFGAPSWASAYEDFLFVLGSLKRSRQPHEIFTRFAKKYGPVYSLNFYYVRFIILSSYDAIREAFQNPFICDRPTIHVLEKGFKGHGVVFSSGEYWKVQRKMALNFLRIVGANRANFEKEIATEATYLCGELRSLNGQSMDPSHLLANATSNIICSVLFGQRYEYSDPRFKRLLEAVCRNMALIGGSTGPLQVFPYALFLKHFVPALKETEANGKLICEFAREVLIEHQKDYNPDSMRDITDVYLKKISSSKTTDSDETDSSLSVTLHDMCATASDLFMAGTETTSTSLRWGLLYMLARPDILGRVQHELDTVVGRDRLPELSDKPNLPYTEATLMEVLRISNILPLGAPHRASQDTTIQGFDIPKDSVIISNLWALTSDCTLWKDPDAFKPERFLDKTGRYLLKYETLIPFSIGRRVCIGENLAKTELFVFLTHLIHQFDFKRPEGSSPISFKGIVGITFSPLPFEVCAIPRD